MPRITTPSSWAGKRSDLGKSYGIFLQQACFDIPSNYRSRLVEIFPNRFTNFRLLVPDPSDLILSKLSRNSDKDRADAMFLFEKYGVNPATLEARYQKELRGYLEDPAEADDTFRLWLAMFRSGICGA